MNEILIVAPHIDDEIISEEISLDSNGPRDSDNNESDYNQT